MSPISTGQAVMDFITERDFETLQWPVQRLAEGCVPHVQAQSLCHVARSDRCIALQARGRDATLQNGQIVTIVGKWGLQLAADSLRLLL